MSGKSQVNGNFAVSWDGGRNVLVILFFIIISNLTQFTGLTDITQQRQNWSVRSLAWKIVFRGRNTELWAKKKKPYQFSQSKVIEKATISLLQVSKICDGRETGKTESFVNVNHVDDLVLSVFGLEFHRQLVIEPHSKMLKQLLQFVIENLLNLL